MHSSLNQSMTMAPRAGFEPATKRLTAVYSTAELPRNAHIEWYTPFQRFCPEFFCIKSIFLCQSKKCGTKDCLEFLIPIFCPIDWQKHQKIRLYATDNTLKARKFLTSPPTRLVA